MNKLLITIYVISIDESYDILLPINLNMSEAIELIQNTIVDLSNNSYVKHSNAILINSQGKKINDENVARFSGLTNGCKVALL